MRYSRNWGVWHSPFREPSTNPIISWLDSSYCHKFIGGSEYEAGSDGGVVYGHLPRLAVHSLPDAKNTT